MVIQGKENQEILFTVSSEPEKFQHTTYFYQILPKKEWICIAYS